VASLTITQNPEKANLRTNSRPFGFARFAGLAGLLFVFVVIGQNMVRMGIAPANDSSVESIIAHYQADRELFIALGASFDGNRRAFGSVRLRHFGARSLVEDDSIRSPATTLINAEAGVRLGGRANLVLDVFNLFDAESSDIDYFYTSRLRDEPSEGVDDIHTHPALPRSLRVSLRVGI